MGFLHKLGLPHVNSFSLSFSLSLPLFFRLIPWNTEGPRVYLFAQASETHTRGSPGGAIRVGICGLRRGCKFLVLRLN